MSEKVYATMASGHGSAFRFDFADGRTPPPQDNWVTAEEAQVDADHWERIADTIGGQAIVVDVPKYIADKAYRLECNGDRRLVGAVKFDPQSYRQ